jgi:hypothetical protein
VSDTETVGGTRREATMTDLDRHRRRILQGSGAVATGGVAGCSALSSDGEETGTGDTPATARSPQGLPAGAQSGLPTDALYAWGLSNPVYPLSEYEDVAAALNVALADMNAEMDYGGTIFLPPAGPQRISSGTVTIPAFGSNDMPAIVGPQGQGAQSGMVFRPTSDFPDASLFELETSGSDGNGLSLANFRVVDPDAVLSDAVFKFRNAARIVMNHVHVWTPGGAEYLLDMEESEGDTTDFLSLYDVNLTIGESGQTCARIAGGQLHVDHCDIGGGGPDRTFQPDTTALAFTGAAGGFLNVYMHKVERGIHLVGKDASGSPEPGRGNVFGFRTERPGQEVRHPVVNEGWHGVTFLPMNVPHAQFRHSLDLGVDTEWVTEAVRSHPQTQLAGGGTGVPNPPFRTRGSVSTENGAVTLRASGNQAAVVDSGGNYPLVSLREKDEKSGGLSERKPTLRAKVDPATGDGAITRVGLAANQWDDWIGVAYDGTEGEYWLRAVRNGELIAAESAGFGPGDGIGDLVTIAHGPATVVRPENPQSHGPEGFASEDGGTILSAAIHQVGAGPQPGTAWITPTIDDQFDGCEPVYALENTAGGTRSARIYEGDVEYTRSRVG